MASVKARCKCMLFSGCYARVASSKPTGVSAEDMIRMSTGLFNVIDMGRVDDDCGKPFRFLQAWDVLQHHEKFMSALSLSSKAHKSDPGISAEVTRSTNEDAASTVGVKNEENTQCRPRQDRQEGRGQRIRCKKTETQRKS